jgi:hypothetical protein
MALRQQQPVVASMLDQPPAGLHQPHVSSSFANTTRPLPIQPPPKGRLEQGP